MFNIQGLFQRYLIYLTLFPPTVSVDLLCNTFLFIESFVVLTTFESFLISLKQPFGITEQWCIVTTCVTDFNVHIKTKPRLSPHASEDSSADEAFFNCSINGMFSFGRYTCDCIYSWAYGEATVG